MLYREIESKIKDHDASLAEIEQQKASKNEVFSMANMGQDIKTAITGGSVAVVGENSVLDVNIVNEQVSAIKTDFLKIGENKLNINKLKVGNYNYSGFINSEANHRYTEPIPVTINKYLSLVRTSDNKKAKLRKIRYVVYLDANYKFISDISYNNPNYSIPNAKAEESVLIPNDERIEYAVVTFLDGFGTKESMIILTDYALTLETQVEYIEFNQILVDSVNLSEKQIEKITAPIYKAIIDDNTNTENILKGKTIYNFGDSIAWGVSSGGVSYAHSIANKNEMTLTNYSEGGATLVVEKGVSNNIVVQIDKASTVIPNYILIEGYTNDTNRYMKETLEVGSITTGYSAELNTSTFCGAFEYILKTALTKWKGAKIIFVTTHINNNRDLVKQTELCDLCLQICKKWGVPVADMFNEGRLNSFLTDHKTYINDGSHPNLLGYETFYVPLIEGKMRMI